MIGDNAECAGISAEIWKRCAKRLHGKLTASRCSAKLHHMRSETASKNVDRINAELKALKRDARWLCKVHIEMAMSEWCEDLIKSDTESGDVVRRIMAATKDGQ